MISSLPINQAAHSFQLCTVINGNLSRITTSKKWTGQSTSSLLRRVEHNFTNVRIRVQFQVTGSTIKIIWNHSSAHIHRNGGKKVRAYADSNKFDQYMERKRKKLEVHKRNDRTFLWPTCMGRTAEYTFRRFFSTLNLTNSIFRATCLSFIKQFEHKVKLHVHKTYAFRNFVIILRNL